LSGLDDVFFWVTAVLNAKHLTRSAIIVDMLHVPVVIRVGSCFIEPRPEPNLKKSELSGWYRESRVLFPVEMFIQNSADVTHPNWLVYDDKTVASSFRDVEGTDMSLGNIMNVNALHLHARDLADSTPHEELDNID
jgi:hypothetical protein